MAKIKIDDLAAELSDSAGISKKLAKIYVQYVFEDITKHLADGDEVVISSFGKFDTAVYAARTGRNIHTGEKLRVPAKHRIKFEMSRALLKAFNAETDSAEEYDEQT